MHEQDPIDPDNGFEDAFDNLVSKGLWKAICWALFITGLAIGIVTTLIKMI
jgi:hypothetical protein